MKAAALLPRVRALVADPPADADLLARFVASRDQAAFAALVRRHGPLVLATARRAAGNATDADDVFQATFLLLARRAAAIRNPAAVAGWLHGVASRMARTARRAATRRRTHESRANPVAPPAPDDLSWREVQALFEQELARLPDRYRVPFVLCALGGEPRADVARRLGIQEGTISSRLAEAKRRLQDGLSARDVSLAAVLGTVSLPALGVSADLISRTMRTAGTGPVPASVAALLRGGVMSARNTLFVVIALSAGVILAASGRAGGPPPQPAGKEVPVAPKEPAKPEPASVRGKLLDAEGKPLANVPVRLWSFRNGDKLPDPTTTTDAAGAFELKPGKQELGDNALVVVSPPGLPAEWVPLSRFRGELTVKLPKDDVPFTGRVLSLENQPLKGVTVEVVRVGTAEEGDLGKWVDKNVTMRKDRYWLNEIGLITLSGQMVLPVVKATTDGDGKFKLTGFGRDRILTVRVHGPNVETKFFWVVARPGGPADGYITTRDFNHGLYPPDVTVRLVPSRPLVGTVTDSKTGKPVPGVVVSEVNHHISKATTDKDGRYRLEGVPKKKNYGLTVTGRKGLPYFDHTHLWVADAAGLDSLETNLSIERGLELTGRVVDKSGRPVGADVYYHPGGNNPNVKDTSQGLISSDGGRTSPDGSFYLTVWPGKGAIDVRARDSDKYAPVDVEKMLVELGILSRPVGPVHAILAIDADESKPDALKLTITLEDAMSRKGTVRGPDGKPLDGVIAAGVRGINPPGAMTSSDFAVGGLRSESHRLLLFIHNVRKLGAIQPVSGDSTDPIQVTLQPLGQMTGEVHKGDKEGWAGLSVTALPMVPDAKKYENLPTEQSRVQGLFNIQPAPWWKLTKRTAKTDANGRFQLEGLLPGLEYTLYVSDGDVEESGTLVVQRRKVTVSPGKATDLGVLMKGDGK
jgi:RNA polymerase sigma factor (sigma-70 family)